MLCFMHGCSMRVPTNLFQIVIVMYVCVCADLIAFAWGRTRVSEAGVPEDLFSPVYGGFYDRIVRLHKYFFHTIP